jgi:hypothetical protein
MLGIIIDILGASSDIQQATRLARAMVTKYGLGDKVGIIFVDEKSKTGGTLQTDVDNEVRALLTSSYERAKKILEDHREDLERIAEGLIEFETLAGGELVDIMNGKKLNPKGPRSQRPSRPLTKLPTVKPLSNQSDSDKSTGFWTSFGAKKTPVSEPIDKRSNANLVPPKKSSIAAPPTKAEAKSQPSSSTTTTSPPKPKPPTSETERVPPKE